MTQAKLYKIVNNQAHCQLCNHYCQIGNESFGACGVRYFKNNQLSALTYGRPTSLGIDPIEKKPLYHFLPGSLAYSLGTWGCNFHCHNCQNWQMSQTRQLLEDENIKYISPEQIIKQALKHNCQSIAYTYNEPTIFFEYALAIMELAHQAGLKNVWVSNGYMSPECRQQILPYLDAINIDLKFFNDELYLKICGAKLAPILENIKFFHAQGVRLELTTLLIPELIEQSQIKQIIKFIKNIDTNIPWHVSRFFPDISWQLADFQTTPLDLLKKTYETAKQAGLRYVYLGNYDDSQYNSTYCPNCQSLMIQRKGYDIKCFDNHGNCAKCKTNLNLIIKS